MDVHVIKARWQEHEHQLKSIRNAVFVVEQDVDPSEEYDEDDKLATHFLAVNELGQYLGCARLTAAGQIGRMAVLASHRGSGSGTLLLQAAVAEGQAQGMTRLFLHAQTYAEHFYVKGGFVRCGEEFEEVNIPHVPMEVKLPLTYEAPRVVTKPAVRQQPIAGDAASSPEKIANLEQAIAGLVKLIDNTRRELQILNPHLDHQLFDQEPVVQAISNMVRNATRARVQVIIMSSKLIIDRGHRLLDLARRLDDKIQIKRLSEDISNNTASFACADRDGYWLLANYDEYQGVYDLGNQVTTQRLRDGFSQAWEKSRTDPELRLLRL